MLDSVKADHTIHTDKSNKLLFGKKKKEKNLEYKLQLDF